MFQSFKNDKCFIKVIKYTEFLLKITPTLGLLKMHSFMNNGPVFVMKC